MKHAQKSQPDFVFETRHWECYLAEDQYYLGRAVVVAKRDVGTLSDLTGEEWTDFGKMVKAYEGACKKAFGATMFNWSCLLNNAYQTETPDPQVHWHVRPRYRRVVEFEGLKFEDKEFGSHYAGSTDTRLTREIVARVIQKLREGVE